MRILIRSLKGRLFLMTESGRWTTNPADAKSFPKSDQAVAAIRALGHADMELYYSYQDEGWPQMDFAVAPEFVTPPEQSGDGEGSGGPSVPSP